MLNSMNYVADERVIRSGEVIAADADLKDPNVKTYYHQVAGACSFLPDGAQITFSGGQYSTKNPDILRFLDAIVDRPGSMVFSRKPGSPITKEAVEVALEVAQPAGNAAQLQTQKATSPAAAALLAQAAQHLKEKPVVATEVEVAAAQK